MSRTQMQQARYERLQKSKYQETVDTVTAAAAIIGIIDTIILACCMGFIMWIAREGYNPDYFTLWQIVNFGAMFATALLPALAIGCFVGGVLYPNLAEDE